MLAWLGGGRRRQLQKDKGSKSQKRFKASHGPSAQQLAAWESTYDHTHNLNHHDDHNLEDRDVVRPPRNTSLHHDLQAAATALLAEPLNTTTLHDEAASAATEAPGCLRRQQHETSDMLAKLSSHSADVQPAKRARWQPPSLDHAQSMGAVSKWTGRAAPTDSATLLHVRLACNSFCNFPAIPADPSISCERPG